MNSFTKHRFHVLDGMRGIAAIMVMLSHYYSRMNYRFFFNTFNAVDFFFILSGFVIYHSYGKKLLGGMSSSDYIACRVARLFPLAAIGVIAGIPGLYFILTFENSDYSTHEIVAGAVSNLLMIPYLNNKGLFQNVGNIFPTDAPLWSIFFEIVASVAFVWFIRLKQTTLLNVCITSFGIIFVASMLRGYTGINRPFFDVEAGWNTETFLGGFPRVIYGFTCGMLIYRLRAAPSSYGFMNRLQQAPAIGVIWLYITLIAILLFPYTIKGLYDLFAIAALAPLLVIQGGNAKCNNTYLLSASKFSGWISYPVYCLHVPVLLGLRAMDERIGFTGYFMISCELTAVMATLLLAIISAFMFDRLALQQNLSTLLRRFIAAGSHVSSF